MRCFAYYLKYEQWLSFISSASGKRNKEAIFPLTLFFSLHARRRKEKRLLVVHALSAVLQVVTTSCAKHKFNCVKHVAETYTRVVTRVILLCSSTSNVAFAWEQAFSSGATKRGQKERAARFSRVLAPEVRTLSPKREPVRRLCNIVARHFLQWQITDFSWQISVCSRPKCFSFVFRKVQAIWGKITITCLVSMITCGTVTFHMLRSRDPSSSASSLSSWSLSSSKS